MKIVSPIRCILPVAGFLVGGASVLAGQTHQIPPTKPSAAISTLPVAQPTGAAGQTNTAPVAPAAPHQIEVEYVDGKLAVKASNASLNEILHEVGHKTGIKITGGVADDKVFGSYGPSSPAVVLDALLDGTGSNILLVDDAKGGSELILTPRRGGVTPPNPNAAQQSSEPDDAGTGAYVPPARPFLPPSPNGRGPEPPAEVQTAVPASDSPDAGGPKTPQQIYDQLQKTMQQQKQNSSSPQ